MLEGRIRFVLEVRIRIRLILGGLDPFYTGVEVGSVLYWEWKLDLIYA